MSVERSSKSTDITLLPSSANMNSSACCHEIEDCPGLYVDAFRTFASKTHDSRCNFILTHYHGDHYNGLPKENKYKGPALVHCTSVTAALLRNVHQVPPQFIVEHEYGMTWKHKINNEKEAVVTFYDANHCPGAAIVLVELPDGTCHLHCGDMRYHEKMKSYPLLQQAVQQRRVGVIYLDTTYGHPKHDLIPQDVAVDTIASFVATVMKEESNTLVLLSCYSIGKEKVLWEAPKRADQLVYVSERKHKMLKCIQGYQEDESSQILTRCTLDPTKSDIHVIPMGMAGEMWPFFRPNYKVCTDYVEKLDKKYDKIVAFLPTGWADSSNWNKKNAINKKRMNFKEKDGHVDVEIRLICYSEHSAFPELCNFVEYLRPRQVVPTVFSDENDRRKIESRFRKLVDTSRAKQHFFKAMQVSSNECSNGKKEKERALDCMESDDEIEVIDVDALCESELKKRKIDCTCSENVSTLISMGFDSEKAQRSLKKCNDNVEAALDDLLKQQVAQNKPAPTKSASGAKSLDMKGSNSSPATIKAFFSPKAKEKK